jgi:hypothetical protein
LPRANWTKLICCSSARSVRVGQQERTLHTRASAPHRIQVIKIALDELDGRKAVGLRFTWVARNGADWYAVRG